MTQQGPHDPEPYTRFANALAKLRHEEQRLTELRDEAAQALRGAKGRLRSEVGRVEEWDKQLEDVRQAIALLESQDSE